MTKLKVTQDLDAPIGVVWKTIRPFDSLKVWHPYVADCVVEDGKALDEIGAVRRITLLDGGGTVRETLHALSDENHTIVYDIIESPMPIISYLSTIILTPVNENKTHGYWTVDFTPEEGEKDNMVKLLTDIYESGFSTLNKLLVGKGTVGV